MSKYKNSGNYDCNCSNDYNIVSGNSLDLDVNCCESEIRADIVVSEFSSVRLWGRIINCDGDPNARRFCSAWRSPRDRRRLKWSR